MAKVMPSVAIKPSASNATPPRNNPAPEILLADFLDLSFLKMLSSIIEKITASPNDQKNE